MLLKNNSEKVKILVRYFEILSIENKLKLFIIVLESDMINLKIDKQNLIELLKNYLCVLDKNYNKNGIITLEYNIDFFISKGYRNEWNRKRKFCIWIIL